MSRAKRPKKVTTYVTEETFAKLGAIADPEEEGRSLSDTASLLLEFGAHEWLRRRKDDPMFGGLAHMLPKPAASEGPEEWLRRVEATVQ